MKMKVILLATVLVTNVFGWIVGPSWEVETREYTDEEKARGTFISTNCLEAGGIMCTVPIQLNNRSSAPEQIWWEKSEDAEIWRAFFKNNPNQKIRSTRRGERQNEDSLAKEHLSESKGGTVSDKEAMSDGIGMIVVSPPNGDKKKNNEAFNSLYNKYGEDAEKLGKSVAEYVWYYDIHPYTRNLVPTKREREFARQLLSFTKPETVEVGDTIRYFVKTVDENGKDKFIFKERKKTEVDLMHEKVNMLRPMREISKKAGTLATRLSIINETAQLLAINPEALSKVGLPYSIKDESKEVVSEALKALYYNMSYTDDYETQLIAVGLYSADKIFNEILESANTQNAIIDAFKVANTFFKIGNSIKKMEGLALGTFNADAKAELKRIQKMKEEGDHLYENLEEIEEASAVIVDMIEKSGGF